MACLEVPKAVVVLVQEAVIQEAKLEAQQEVLKVVSLVVYLEEPKVVDARAQEAVIQEAQQGVLKVVLKVVN